MRSWKNCFIIFSIFLYFIIGFLLYNFKYKFNYIKCRINPSLNFCSNFDETDEDLLWSFGRNNFSNFPKNFKVEGRKVEFSYSFLQNSTAEFQIHRGGLSCSFKEIKNPSEENYKYDNVS